MLAYPTGPGVGCGHGGKSVISSAQDGGDGTGASTRHDVDGAGASGGKCGIVGVKAYVGKGGTDGA